VLTQVPAIDPDDLEARAALTARLARSEPLLTELRGWGPIDGTLPAELLDFVSFLESSSGLAAPVGLLSLGPTALGKRFLERADAGC
jgi:hypothetical protein